MRQTIILFCAVAATALGQTGRITGFVVDDSGAPLQGAFVTAALWSTPQPIEIVPGRAPAFMPTPANARSGTKGDFQIDGLITGQYHVCVESPEASILNPCLWGDTPVRVDVTTGATTSAVSVIAARGITVTVRVHDVKGLLKANPAADDVRVGTFYRVQPFIPGRVSDRDLAGRTISVIVPRGKDAVLAISSSRFALEDDKGASVADKEISIPAAVIAKGGAGPVITVQVTGAKDSKP